MGIIIATTVLVTGVGLNANAATLPARQSGDQGTVLENPGHGPNVLRGERGKIVGYTIDLDMATELRGLSAELGFMKDRIGDDSSAMVRAYGFFDVAACVGAIGVFAGMTVFPTARAAKVAIRLGGIVAKYGVKKTARILTGVAKGVKAAKIRENFFMQASGIGALGACVP